MFSIFKKKKPIVIMGSTEANELVRQQLHGFGDDGIAQRHVIHYAYPSGSSDPVTRRKIDAWLYEQSFKVKSAEARDGVVFETTQSITGEEFDLLTQSFIIFFEGLDWEYDGWECAVSIATEPT